MPSRYSIRRVINAWNLDTEWRSGRADLYTDGSGIWYADVLLADTDPKGLKRIFNWRATSVWLSDVISHLVGSLEIEATRQGVIFELFTPPFNGKEPELIKRFESRTDEKGRLVSKSKYEDSVRW